MQKYHVNNENEIKPCSATYQECQFGNYAHFWDKDDAQELVDLKLSVLSKFGTLSKTSPKPTTPLEDKLILRGKIPEYRRSESVDYEELWINDEKGNPAIYTKINRKLYDVESDSYTDGVVLCDIESNPKLRGNNHAIEALRILKKNYNVDTIYTTGTFSKAGFKFYMKLQEIEKQTGEKLLTVLPYEQISIDPVDGYNFVESWDEELSKYPVT